MYKVLRETANNAACEKTRPEVKREQSETGKGTSPSTFMTKMKATAGADQSLRDEVSELTKKLGALKVCYTL